MHLISFFSFVVASLSLSHLKPMLYLPLVLNAIRLFFRSYQSQALSKENHLTLSKIEVMVTLFLTDFAFFCLLFHLQALYLLKLSASDF